MLIILNIFSLFFSRDWHIVNTSIFKNKYIKINVKNFKEERGRGTEGGRRENAVSALAPPAEVGEPGEEGRKVGGDSCWGARERGQKLAAGRALAPLGR